MRPASDSGKHNPNPGGTLPVSALAGSYPAVPPDSAATAATPAKTFCHDARHTVPCPLPCDVCADECDPSDTEEHLGMDSPIVHLYEGTAIVVYVRAHTHRCTNDECWQDWTCLDLACGPFGPVDQWTGMPDCGWAVCPDCLRPGSSGAALEAA